MNKLRLLLILGGVITLGAVSQSCLDENNEDVSVDSSDCISYG